MNKFRIIKTKNNTFKIQEFLSQHSPMDRYPYAWIDFDVSHYDSEFYSLENEDFKNSFGIYIEASEKYKSLYVAYLKRMESHQKAIDENEIAEAFDLETEPKPNKNSKKLDM